jgi:1-phosphatidylinositol-4-phosphate 5-kinase
MIRDDFTVELKADGSWVKSFAPSEFDEIRKVHKISDLALIKSLDPINNREQIFKSNE